jgi:hypothetical protein
MSTGIGLNQLLVGLEKGEYTKEKCLAHLDSLQETMDYLEDLFLIDKI